MPSANKAMKVVFDSGKTSSYHIKSIADCQQSAKTSSIFKVVLNRGAGNKRYDFEAESPRLAGLLSSFLGVICWTKSGSSGNCTDNQDSESFP